MKKIVLVFMYLILGMISVGCEKKMLSLNGENSKNYEIIRETTVKEQGLDIVELSHKKTKAKVLLFMCDDENRVFNIVFKTPVENSKGMPHILEHSVLCGSKKYDVKDPFMQLSKGSLNTFLNAFTYPDKTCYPVASANIKDFHNLVDVYLDAVFYPNVLVKENFFKQEGWHYEIEKKTDDLKVSGVVYNEMKGVYSDPSSLLESAILRTLYKGSTYEYESGGHPEEIINLSYDEFVDFHHKYYSASNSTIFYYGKLDFNEELSYLDKEYLSKQEYVDCDSTIDDAADWDAYDEAVDYYNIDSDDTKDKSYISYSFSMDSEKDSTKNIAMKALSYMLFTSEGAVLRDKCLNEGLGESVNATYEPGIKRGMYYIIAQNIDASKKDKFVKVIDDSIKEILEKGIDKDKLKAALNVLYFNYAEDEFSSYPRGLSLIQTSLETYLYGDPIETFLSYEEAFRYLNAVNLDEKDNYFTRLLREVFVDNEHRCVNILNPKKGLVLENEAKLNALLRERKMAMSDDDIEKLIDDVSLLKEFQAMEDPKEKLDTLPKLKVSDIERDKKIIEYKTRDIEGSNSIYSYDNEKDIIYFDMAFDVTGLSDEELHMLSAMGYLISKVDLKDMSYEDLSTYIDMHTGGFGASLEVFNEKVFLTFKMKSSIENVDYVFEIYNKLRNNMQFVDKDRISILLSEYKTSSFLSMLSNGHQSSINRALSYKRWSSKVSDMMTRTGVSFNLFIDDLSKNYAKNADLINKLYDKLYKKVMSQEISYRYSVNEKYAGDVEKKIDAFAKAQKSLNLGEYESDLKSLIDDSKAFIKYESYEKSDRKEAIITPNDINFCAVGDIFDKEKYSGVLRLLGTIFDYEYLWTKLRVLGGAYGCFSLSSRVGYYGFVSYRDPNLSNTNKVYEEVYDYLKNFDKTDEELELYIIGTMGPMDNPISPHSRFERNVAAYYSGVDNDTYNKERHEVLDVKVRDIKNLAEIFKDMKDEASYCALITAKAESEAKGTYDRVWKLSK